MTKISKIGTNKKVLRVLQILFQFSKVYEDEHTFLAGSRQFMLANFFMKTKNHVKTQTYGFSEKNIKLYGSVKCYVSLKVCVNGYVDLFTTIK